MLTRSQTRMNSNKSITSDVHIPKNKVMPVATQQRMITRSQARKLAEEDETEVITLHVNPSKNRRIIPDDNDITPRRSSRININFDEASKAWRSVGNGQFEYI